MAKSTYCPYCQSRVLASYRGATVWPHAALVIATCGLWIPIALLVVCFGGSYVCQRCGTEVR
jgi:DNA-directed RNA polymerase subunit RPC12/RpoP